MNQKWLKSILLVSIFLLTCLKIHEVQSLKVYFQSSRIIKLKHFQEARKKIDPRDSDLLELWESMLTGRVAPVSKMLKNQFIDLGMSHIFTPSGFHLSAVLLPFMKIIKSSAHQMIFFLFLGFGLSFLPGFVALKRMLLVKGHQKIFGIKTGFCMAFLLDAILGSFSNGPLSFTYSLLFLGIVYSGLKGGGLIIWFFLAQMLIAFYQGSQISILLLIFSPLIQRK